MSEVVIPPAQTIGPVADSVSTIVDRVRANLNADAGDIWVDSAVDAALVYVISYTNRDAIGLPDDALTVNGLVGFATRIYQDGFSPNGVQLAVVDPTFEPVFQPEHLYKHWRHYFDRLDRAWGIA